MQLYCYEIVVSRHTVRQSDSRSVASGTPHGANRCLLSKYSLVLLSRPADFSATVSSDVGAIFESSVYLFVLTVTYL